MKRLLLLSCLGLLFTTPAFAESPALVDAEQAYQSVDFPATHTLARKALEAGGNDREQTARLYVLLGISAAALGDAEEAKANFVVALAVKPSLKLDLHLAARGVSARPSFSLAAAPSTRFPLPRAVQGHSYEYTLRALDRFGNVLAERGTDADPELVREAAHAGPADRAANPAQHGRSYVLPIALGVAGLGAVTAGVAFQVKRENAARDWNSGSCEQPGQTRIQQCQDVDDRRQKYEHLAIGFYAAGGALLTGSVIALIVGRPAASTSQRAGLLGCGVVGTGVSCDGRF